MFITDSFGQLTLRDSQSPQRNVQPKYFDMPPSPPWDGISFAFSPSTPPNDLYSSPPVSDIGSPASRASSPRAGPLKRGRGDDNDYAFALPSFQGLLSCDEYYGTPYASSLRYTPSVSSDLSDDGVYSSRPSLFLGPDLITEKLNCFRRTENKHPLPPLEGLFELPRERQCVANDAAAAYQHFLNHAAHEQAVLQTLHSPPPQQTKPQRKRVSQKAHCNIKYLVEELDYIRYQRVDLAQQWPQVEAKFTEKFPMVVFPKQREKEGLQGVNYRQNECLPHLRNDRLVFMKNGHVAAVCTKVRAQSEQKYHYTLVYLFPERAMHYPWVSPAERQQAAKLNEDRQRQKEEARRAAQRLGLYVETLPANRKCGCCPAKDRQRNMPKSQPDEVEPQAKRRLLRK